MSGLVDVDGLPFRGEVRDGGRQDDDLVLYSVTTVLGVIDKAKSLVPWAVNTTAERTVDAWPRIERRLTEEGRDAAVDLIKGLRWETGGDLSEANLGTLAHDLAHQYAETGVRPDVTPDLHPEFASKGLRLSQADMIRLVATLDRFDEFLQRFQPHFLGCETVVYHPLYGYAGQLDAIFEIDGVRLIADYKTSRTGWTAAGKPKSPYPESALQVTAYRNCTHAAIWRARRYENRSRRYYLMSPAERAAALPVPEVDGGVVIHLSPDRYAVHPVRCGPREFEAFLYTLETARWVFNEASSVVGDEMEPPFPPAELGDPFAGLPTE